MDRRFFLISGNHVNVQKGNYFYDFLVEKGVSPICFYDFRRGQAHKRIKRKLRGYMNLMQLFLRSRENDVIFFYDNRNGLTLAKWFANFGLKRHVFLNNFMGYGHNVSAGKIKGFQKAMRNACVACNSEALKQQYIEAYGAPKNRLFVIPDCVDVFHKDIEKGWGELSNLANESSDTSYVFMGGNTRRDYDLLKAVAQRMPDVQFVVIANPNAKAEFAKKPENVSVSFGLPFEDFMVKLAQSKVVFVPLKSDIQGGQLVLFEATLLHKPVITTDTSAIGTYYTHKENAFLIPVGDVDTAEKSLKEVLEMPQEQLLKMTESAYRSIKRYNGSNISNLYMQMIETGMRM